MPFLWPMMPKDVPRPCAHVTSPQKGLCTCGWPGISRRDAALESPGGPGWEHRVPAGEAPQRNASGCAARTDTTSLVFSGGRRSAVRARQIWSLARALPGLQVAPGCVLRWPLLGASTRRLSQPWSVALLARTPPRLEFPSPRSQTPSPWGLGCNRESGDATQPTAAGNVTTGGAAAPGAGSGREAPHTGLQASVASRHLDFSPGLRPPSDRSVCRFEPPGVWTAATGNKCSHSAPRPPLPRTTALPLPGLLWAVRGSCSPRSPIKSQITCLSHPLSKCLLGIPELVAELGLGGYRGPPGPTG